MRTIKNSNIFAGDRDYKTNFFLKFFSNKTEQRFQDETILRNRYSLQGFLTLSLCYHVISFTQSDCFFFAHGCDHGSLLLVTMALIIAALFCIQRKMSPNITQLLIIPSTLYQYYFILETYNHHTDLILMTLYTTLTSFLIHPVWLSQAIYNLLSYGIFFLYLRSKSAGYVLQKPELETMIDLLPYNLVSIMFLAFVEKDRKEKWVLLDTFKKSERIFRNIYEGLPYPMFILDNHNRVLFTNSQGTELLSNYVKGCISSDLGKKNVHLDKIISGDCLEEATSALKKVSCSKSPETCYVSLKIPADNLPENLENTIGKNNYYKMVVSSILWKKSYVNMVTLRDYSSKKKSEIISTKAVSALIKEVQGVIKKCEEFTSQNDSQKMKIDVLAQANTLKLSVFNTKILFNQIFEKKEGLKEETNFNIQKVILSSIATLSPLLKQRSCDLQLKFEPSFPQLVYGDEFLFEQIFFNAMSIFLQKLNKKKVTIECKLSTFLQNGNLLLSFDLEIPKDKEIEYDPINSSFSKTRKASLDHFIENDQCLFAFAVVQPGIETLGGSIDLEDRQNGINLSIKLPFRSHDNSKQTNQSVISTFESTEFNSSSKPSLFTYYWNFAESKNGEFPGSLGETGSLPTSLNLANLKKPDAENANKKKGHSRTNSFEQTSNRDLSKRRDYKIMAQLKNITENDKNYGSVPHSANSSNPESPCVSTSSTIIVNKYEKLPSADSNASIYLEEKKEVNKEAKENNRDRMKIQAPKIILNKPDDQKDAKPESLWDKDSSPDIMSLHIDQEQSFKLAMAKALMTLIDLYREKVSMKQMNYEIGSTLEALTLQERMKEEKINEQALYLRTVEYLSGKLEDENFRNNFFQFIKQDVEDFQREIELLEARSVEQPQNKLFLAASEVIIENSPITVMRRAVTSNKNELLNCLGRRSANNICHLAVDTNRSKERSLNERFLLSPSISKSFSSRRSMLDKVDLDQVLDRSLPKDKKPEPIDFKAEREKRIKLKKELCPFNVPNLPPGLAARTKKHTRKWEAISAIVKRGASARSYTYNEVFTILVVDDSDFVFKALSSLPLKYKVNLEFAKNGTEALKKYLHSIGQGTLYHLILMDVQMPVMDGYETTRNIRAEELSKQYPQTYICAMSAFDEPEYNLKAKREGMNNYCQKPMRVELVHNLIKTRCEEIGIPLIE